MALRCSLLGHDYGDPEVEREREERGSEVVVTVQEFEECTRCGDRNVLSENTEVTSLSAATDADSLPPEPEPETAIPDSDAETVEPPTGAADEVAFGDDADGDFIDAEADEPAAAADESTDDFDVPTDENGDPVTDDGEILDDDDDPVHADREREHGEWPDSDDVGPPVGSENEPSGWPDSDEGGDREDDPDVPIDAELEDPVEPDEAVTDDAVVLEDDTGTVSGGRGESTAAADARSVTAEPPNAPETQGSPDAGPATDRESAESGAASGSGIERAESAPTPSQSDGSLEDVPTEFYCPRCDYVSDGNRGSLRAGDICPDCRKGYLGERERR